MEPSALGLALEYRGSSLARWADVESYSVKATRTHG